MENSHEKITFINMSCPVIMHDLVSLNLQIWKQLHRMWQEKSFNFRGFVNIKQERNFNLFFHNVHVTWAVNLIKSILYSFNNVLFLYFQSFYLENKMIAKLHILISPLRHYQILMLVLTVNMVSEMQCHLIKNEDFNKN